MSTDKAMSGFAVRELARRRLMDFAQSVSRGFQDVRHTRYLADVLEQVERGDVRRVIINAPPGFGKSTLLQCWAAWFLGRNPQRRIIAMSASESLAVRNSTAIRSFVTSDEWPWPAIKLSADTTSKQNWSTDAGGGVRAIGQGGTVTGFRCEAIVCDDIQADSGSPATRDSLEEWFRGVMSTRLEPDGVCVLIQTRWTQDDIVGRLLEGESGDQWTHINLPALALDNDVLGREPGESLWPERWPVDIIEQRRAEVGTYAFESQYMGNPTPEGGRVFAPEWFSKRYSRDPREIAPPAPKPRMEFYGTALFYEQHQSRPQPIIVTALDAALKDNVASDFSALCTVMLHENSLYVLEVERARVPFDRLLAMVIDHYARHQPRAVIIEDTALGAPAVQELQRATMLPVIPVQPSGSKVSRAMSIVPQLEAGRVVLPEAAPWLRDFMPELLSFPGGRHDDQVDAFVMAVTWAQAIAQREEHYEAMSQRLAGWMAR